MKLLLVLLLFIAINCKAQLIQSNNSLSKAEIDSFEKYHNNYHNPNRSSFSIHKVWVHWWYPFYKAETPAELSGKMYRRLRRNPEM